MSGGRFNYITINGQTGEEAKIGTVVDITTSGTGVVQPSGSARGQPLMGFTFDKLDGYRGQTPREYGVFVGTTVRFQEEGGHIRKIWVVEPKRG